MFLTCILDAPSLVSVNPSSTEAIRPFCIWLLSKVCLKGFNFQLLIVANLFATSLMKGTLPEISFISGQIYNAF